MLRVKNNVGEERRKLGIMICVEEMMGGGGGGGGGGMVEIGWGRCGEGRQDVSAKMGSRCGVVSFIPPSPTQHISQHHNTLTHY